LLQRPVAYLASPRRTLEKSVENLFNLNKPLDSKTLAYAQSLAGDRLEVPSAGV